MDPLKIEEADREFVQKLHELRSKLAGRQEASANKRSRKKVLPRTTAAIALSFIVAGVGYAVLYYKTDVSPSMSRLEGEPVDNRPAPVEEINSRQVPAGPGPADGTDQHTLPSVQPAEPVVTASPVQLPRMPEEGVNQEMAALPEAVPISEKTPRDANAKDIELVSSVVCEGVHKHQPMNETDRFNLAKTRRAYVWMEVRSKEQPFVMQHVYYLNGRKYCEVSLKIRYPRMRTWSYVTLQKADQTGSWTVEVIHDNRVLETVGFQVSSDDAIASELCALCGEVKLKYMR